MTLKYPHLYSYAKETVISLEKVMNTVNLVDLFCIPMSRQAFEELQLLAEDVSSLIAGSSEGKDHWTLSGERILTRSAGTIIIIFTVYLFLSPCFGFGNQSVSHASNFSLGLC
jgi:hypothetical protein